MANLNADRNGGAAPVVRGFLNVSTGRPAACDTEVTLTREGADLVVRAHCHSDGTGVAAADRLTISFDPAGREADVLAVVAGRGLCHAEDGDRGVGERRVDGEGAEDRRHGQRHDEADVPEAPLGLLRGGGGRLAHDTQSIEGRPNPACG